MAQIDLLIAAFSRESEADSSRLLRVLGIGSLGCGEASLSASKLV